MIVCTEPLPKVWVPITMPAPQSWSAPATISDADALPLVDEHDHREVRRVAFGMRRKRMFWFRTRPSV